MANGKNKSSQKQNIQDPIHKRLRKIFNNKGDRINRSKTGNMMLTVFVGLFAAFSFIPLVLAVGMSLKPINELFVFPPTLWPRKPTFDNFKMLFSLITTTWVPFSRYLLNTVIITVASTAGNVIFASMAAYPLAKHHFPGKKLLNALVLLSLMFVASIGDVVNYMTISGFHWIDTYWAVIIPNIGMSLGLFLLTNYMTTIPTTLLEAAKIDGCSEFRIFGTIVMPIVKPAWLTLIIIMFQNVWGQPHNLYIYKESMKSLPYALSQIVAGGYIRVGAGQAVGILMLILPAAIFIFNQTKILDTMASSGIKE